MFINTHLLIANSIINNINKEMLEIKSKLDKILK